MINVVVAPLEPVCSSDVTGVDDGASDTLLSLRIGNLERINFKTVE